MSLGKKDIIKNISIKTHITNIVSSQLLESFLNQIKSNIINNNNIKISNFGAFCLHTTPRRLGRNPKSMQEYQIPEIKKASFKASKRIKSIIN
jgi:nucleoid DNA-binding protein